MNKRMRQNENKKNYIKECLRQSYKKKPDVPDELYEKYNFVAPKIFSFIENPKETIKYFNQIILSIRRYKGFLHIRYDLSEINFITIDAVIYMVALSLNINNQYKPKFNILGPENKQISEFILSSGITDFFDVEEEAKRENNDYFSMKMGNKTNVELAQNICDFTNLNLNVDFKETKFLYDMLIEMMTNTGQHAYTKGETVKKQWLIFAEYSNDKVKYTFMDTGLGIPATMSDHELTMDMTDNENDDYIINVLDKFTDERKKDSILLASGLTGNSTRTRTNMSHRGKGLPEIYNHYKDKNKTSFLKIISGGCLCEFDEDNREQMILTELSEKLLGSLFYWEININDLKRGRTKNEI